MSIYRLKVSHCTDKSVYSDNAFSHKAGPKK